MENQYTISRVLRERVSEYLEDLFGKDAITELLRKFDTDLKASISKVEQFISTRNANGSRSEVHKLKGVLLNSNLSDEAGLSEKIERLLMEKVNWSGVHYEWGLLLERLTEKVSTLDRVLIVEDAAFEREYLKTAMHRLFPSITTFESEDGRSALEMLTKERFDIILCDWELPDIKGDEILLEVRNNPKINSTPFIMVTANNQRDFIITAVQLGVDDYIVKPVKMEVLDSKIRRALNRNNASL